LLGFLLVAFLVSRPVYQLSQNEYSSSPLDEMLVAAVAMFAPFGVLRLSKTPLGMKFLLAAAAYVAMIMVSSFSHDYSFERGRTVFYVGLLLDLKMLVLFFGVYNLSQGEATGRKDRTIDLVVLALIAIAVLNSFVVLRDVFSNGVGIDGSPLKMRGPFYRPNGLFHHPVASAQVTLMGLIASLGRIARRNNVVNFSVAGFLFSILLAHISVKEIVVGFLALVAYIMLYIRKDMLLKAVLAMLGAAIVGGVLASPIGDQIIGRTAYYASDEGSDTVRRALYAGGWQIAVDLAPLGSGASSFASEGSRMEGYSSLYFSYGVFGRWGASYSKDDYLVDVYWPKVMAESGFIGLGLLLLTVLIPLSAAWRLLRRWRAPEDFVLVTSMAGILIISVASPALSEEFSGVIFFSFAAIALARWNAVAFRMNGTRFRDRHLDRRIPALALEGRTGRH
jgi:hypothetical protein